MSSVLSQCFPEPVSALARCHSGSFHWSRGKSWDGWVVLSWSHPPLSFSLYSALRFFLSLFPVLMVQHILFRPSHYLFKSSCTETDNLIPCPPSQVKRGPAWTPEYPAGNGGAADQTIAQQKEFSFLSCCTHLAFPFLNFDQYYSFYTLQTDQIFQIQVAWQFVFVPWTNDYGQFIIIIFKQTIVGAGITFCPFDQQSYVPINVELLPV